MIGFNRIAHFGKISLGLMLLLTLAACGGQIGSPEKAPQLLMLLENEAKWTREAPADFSYQWRQACFCLFREPVRVLYADGEFVHAVPLEPSENGRDRNDQPYTVEALFDVIRRALADKDAEVTVEYDATYGYPTQVSIDWIPAAVDDEINYIIEDFASADPTEAELVQNLRTWHAQKWVTYDFQLTINCFCIPRGAIRVNVVDNEPTSARAIDEARELTEEELQTLPLTIDRLFDTALRAHFEGRTVRAEFAAEAYPTEIAIDEAAIPADGGVIYQVNDLVPATD